MKDIGFGQQGTSVTDGLTWSPAVWGNCPWDRIIREPNLGRFIYDDFKDFPLVGTQTTEIAHGRWKVFNTGAAKVSPVSAVNSAEIAGGCLRFALDTDNDSGSLAQAYPTFRMSGLASTSGPLWCEFIWAQNSIVTNLAAVMLLMAETELWTLATAVPFNASDSITNGAAGIGFRIEEDGLGVVDTVITDRATSFTNIGDTEAGTLAAYTFKHFAILYDPTNASRCVRFFVDNVECTTAYTSTQVVATTNFKANALGPIIATCADSAGTTYEGYLRGVRIAQLNPGVSV